MQENSKKQGQITFSSTDPKRIREGAYISVNVGEGQKVLAIKNRFLAFLFLSASRLAAKFIK